jgi:nucleotide-binding universal stress UspA family protein
MYQRILVPVDGSVASNRGLAEAVRLAQATGACLRLLHVMDPLTFATGFESVATYNSDVVPMMTDAARKILEDAGRRAEACGVAFDTLLIDNFALPISERVEACVNAWNADLVVIGTHGRRGLKRVLMGSDAEQIMRLSPVPVLLVKAPADAEVPATAASTQSPAARPGKTCHGACPCTPAHAN